MRLFIDTWGWLTLRDKSESRHAEVSRFYRDFRRHKGTAYTSDYVLDETILTSMVIMTECGVTEIKTEDEHFLQVGMGFQRVP